MLKKLDIMRFLSYYEIAKWYIFVPLCFSALRPFGAMYHFCTTETGKNEKTREDECLILPSGKASIYKGLRLT